MYKKRTGWLVASILTLVMLLGMVPQAKATIDLPGGTWFNSAWMNLGVKACGRCQYDPWVVIIHDDGSMHDWIGDPDFCFHVGELNQVWIWWDHAPDCPYTPGWDTMSHQLTAGVTPNSNWYCTLSSLYLRMKLHKKYYLTFYPTVTYEAVPQLWQFNPGYQGMTEYDP